MVINLISPSGRFTSVALIERFIGSDVRMEVSDQAGERAMPSHGWTDHADVFMVSLSCLASERGDVALIYRNSVKLVVADDKLMICCGISLAGFMPNWRKYMRFQVGEAVALIFIIDASHMCSHISHFQADIALRVSLISWGWIVDRILWDLFLKRNRLQGIWKKSCLAKQR